MIIMLKYVPGDPPPIPLTGICPGGGTATFEKVTGCQVRGATLSPLFSRPDGAAITADCAARCLSSPSCPGFVLNYRQQSCHAVAVGDSRREALTKTQDPTNYFEKICLNGILHPIILILKALD
ncbi:hypothetical protein LAZ67_17003076 [Cordylochernes scorpioides]|uniref:Apple domain-containing protein n=1 Tax=Cordylochernes scorpioides TaxID=51811 RepID=A0ABY6LH79_9ARAC|nr:hypothetical protein LAZ67_17003076 [Cordylochernes scorpioides]